MSSWFTNMFKQDEFAQREAAPTHSRADGPYGDSNMDGTRGKKGLTEKEFSRTKGFETRGGNHHAKGGKYDRESTWPWSRL